MASALVSATPTLTHLMPVAEIAEALGVGITTVKEDLANALHKLRDTGTYAGLLDLVQARLNTGREPGGCISAECNREWINTWAPGDSTEDGRPARVKQRRLQERGTSDRGGFMRKQTTH